MTSGDFPANLDAMKATFYICGLGTITFARGSDAKFIALRARDGHVFSILRTDFNTARAEGKFGRV